MDESKTTAILVALEELGYETTITGEGLKVASLLEGVPASDTAGDIPSNTLSTPGSRVPFLFNIECLHCMG